MTDRRRALGTLGEEIAAAHYRRLGFATVARNVRSRHGEIDLIAFDGGTLAFVEVKTRRVRSRCGAGTGGQQPLAWLSPRQRIRLRGLARAWLHEQREERPHARDLRFDAVGVLVDESGRLLRLDQVENAW